MRSDCNRRSNWLQVVILPRNNRGQKPCPPSYSNTLQKSFYILAIPLPLLAQAVASLQECLQQRQRNTSLQQLYNMGNSVGMVVRGFVITPTQCLIFHQFL